MYVKKLSSQWKTKCDRFVQQRTNLVAGRQTWKMPSTTSGAGQTQTNLGKQKQQCFVSKMIWQVICSSLYVVDFAVKLITFSFPNNMNPGHTTNTSDLLPESLLFSEDSSMLGSSSLGRTYLSAKNKKAQDRWSKEEEKLLVQLWAERHSFAGNHVALTAWHDVLFADFVLKCSFPDKFFVTGRFQVGFVQNKSEIVL